MATPQQLSLEDIQKAYGNYYSGFTPSGLPILKKTDTFQYEQKNVLPKSMGAINQYFQPAYQGAQASIKDLAGLAQSQGPTSFAQSQLEAQQTAEQLAQSKAQQQAQSQAQAAQSNLAMRGGISSGSRERIASLGIGNTLAAAQNIGAQGQTQRQAILGADAAYKQNLLGQLPSQYAALGGLGLQGAGQVANVNQFAANQNFQTQQAQEGANRYTSELPIRLLAGAQGLTGGVLAGNVMQQAVADEKARLEKVRLEKEKEDARLRAEQEMKAAAAKQASGAVPVYQMTDFGTY